MANLFNYLKFNTKNMNTLIKKLENLRKDLLNIKNTIQPIDLLAVLIIPLIISVIFLLPSQIQEILRLNIEHPNSISIFLSSYSHTDYSHYSNNLIPFLFIIILQLVIVAYIHNKKAFFRFLWSTALILPFVISSFKLWIYPILLSHIKVSQGLSGINAAIIGSTPFILFRYLFRKNAEYNTWIFGFIISYSGLIISIEYWKYPLIPIIMISVLILSLINIVRDRDKNLKLSKCIKDNSIVFSVALTLLLLYLIYPLILFPKNILRTDNVIDIVSHYIGFVYGTIAAYIIFKN